MSNGRFWMLGAEDPEMKEIEKLLRECGETVGYATAAGKRVHPGNAYQADGVEGFSAWPTHFVECGLEGTSPYWELVYTGALPPVPFTFDHHRPGDPGFGKPPAEFLSASSIGQVLLALTAYEITPWKRLKGGRTEGFHLADGWLVSNGSCATLVPRDIALTAAADHCLSAAYAGKCPGIDPDELYQYRILRVLTNAAPGRTERTAEEVLGYRRIAEKALLTAPRISLGGVAVADLRGVEVVDLPEHACRYGIAYLATPPAREGERRKVVLGGCGECTVPGVEPVKEFLESWASAQGLVEPYGDPVRGFAGAYLA